MNGAALIATIVAYLVGSFPTAFLVGKANGIDLRTVGSGNLGATNVLRSIGWRAGLLVYVVDMAKGALPVYFFPQLAGIPAGGAWNIVFGLAAIAGHVRPVFLMGKGGGKGVATASGVFLGLAPVPAACAFVAFMLVVSVTRYVSLASLVGAIVLPVAMLVMQRGFTPLVAVSACVSAFVFWTHRENIDRLRRGTERRVGRSSEVTQ